MGKDARKFLDNKTVMGLDNFGYPATHMANSVLTELEDLGDDTKKLESSWFDWLHYNPFDTRVASRLAELYQKRLTTLDEKRDADRVQQLQKKLKLTNNRIKRYHDLHFANRSDFSK